MRFIPFAKDIFAKRMRDKINDAWNANVFTRGGWEVWAQVETALEALEYDNNFVLEREVYYPGTLQRCDFVITPSNADAARIWVELKVELQSGLANLGGRFLDDVDKMFNNKQNIPWTDSGGAISYSVWNARDYIMTLRDLIQPNYHRFYYYVAFNDQTQMLLAKRLDDQMNLPSNQNACVAYRAIISENLAEAEEDSGAIETLAMVKAGESE